MKGTMYIVILNIIVIVLLMLVLFKPNKPSADKFTIVSTALGVAYVLDNNNGNVWCATLEKKTLLKPAK